MLDQPSGFAEILHNSILITLMDQWCGWDGVGMGLGGGGGNNVWPCQSINVTFLSCCTNFSKFANTSSPFVIAPVQTEYFFVACR